MSNAAIVSDAITSEITDEAASNQTDGKASPETTPDTSDKPKRGPKPGSTRKREFVVPDGGFKSHEVPGFDIAFTGGHSKLELKDFASDPLNYHKWHVAYYQRLLEMATQGMRDSEASGDTADKRRKMLGVASGLSKVKTEFLKVKAEGGEFSDEMKASFMELMQLFNS